MSRRTTRSQTVYLEKNPRQEVLPVIKKPKISPPKKSKTLFKKQKTTVSPIVSGASGGHGNILTSTPKVVLVRLDGAMQEFRTLDLSRVNRTSLDNGRRPTSTQPVVKIEQIAMPRATVSLAKLKLVSKPIEPTFANTSEKSISTPVQSNRVPVDDATTNSTESDATIEHPSQIKAISSLSSKASKTSVTRRSTRIKQNDSKTVTAPTKTAAVVRTKTATVAEIVARSKTLFRRRKTVGCQPVPEFYTNDLTSPSNSMIAYRRKTSTTLDKNKNKHQTKDIISISNGNGNKGGIEIIIPSELKKLIVKDSININKKKRLYQIPATNNIATIIEDYIALKQTQRNDESQNGISFEVVLFNVLDYFDTLLCGQLLYESEREYNVEVMNNFPGEKMSKVYPPIYLLRLLVQMNKLMEFSNRDKDSLQCIVNHVNDFTKYLAENSAALFDLNNFR